VFAVASAFVLKSTLRQLGGGLSPQTLFYGLHKTRLRLSRMVEAVEGATGATVHFPGDLEVIMSSFAGKMRLTDDGAVWWLASEPAPS